MKGSWLFPHYPLSNSVVINVLRKQEIMMQLVFYSVDAITLHFNNNCN